MNKNIPKTETNRKIREARKISLYVPLWRFGDRGAPLPIKTPNETKPKVFNEQN